MSASDAGVAAAPTGKAESILAAAQRTFLANGFGAASMDAIAREAGASKATLYAYFASKEELFGAVVARESERYAREFPAGELDPHEVEASLTLIADRFLRLLLSPEVIAINRIIIGEVARFPVLAEVFWRAGPERIRAQVEGFLRRAAAVGSVEVPDTRLAAEQFTSLVRGEIHLQRLLGLGAAEPDAIAAAARAAVATFRRAFSAKA
ncbi:MAG: TetR/AcrR family transcriptional regulator [Alphaproteobacteria bacterium]|nr:TetR/AcrR family transcriptional regulator [Alphaproteobacteria bacterium]